MVTLVVFTVMAPENVADATWAPFTYSRCVVPSNVPTTWYVPPATIVPTGAWTRRRVPLRMVVNSICGPLNCREYDSALVAREAKLPAAGSFDGRTHASTVTALLGLRADVLGTDTTSFTPSKVAAGFAASDVNRLGAPRVTPLRYVPGLPPTTSAATVPDVSPSRQ